jgi:hypothetical protein
MILPKGNKKVLFQRKIIQPSISFEDCGIADHERILVLFEEQLSMKYDMICVKPILKKRADNFDQESGPLAKKEFFRMVDLVLLKIENEGKLYRQECQTLRF